MTIVDDLDGSELANGTAPTRFSLNGSSYELDLGPASAARLSEALAPFIEKARRAGAISSRRTAGSKSAGNSEASAIRAWAAERDMAVPARGRIPKAVADAYAAR